MALYSALKGKARHVWILDADLAAAFDKISHPFLLGQLGTFPAMDMIADGRGVQNGQRQPGTYGKG